jgi:hypothetical protein
MRRSERGRSRLEVVTAEKKTAQIELEIGQTSSCRLWLIEAQRACRALFLGAGYVISELMLNWRLTRFIAMLI